MPTKIKCLNVQEAFNLLEKNKNALLIDVREKEEIDDLAPAIGIFFPMSKINPNTFAEDCKVKKNQPILLFCRSGGRSMRVAEALANCGFEDLTNVAGGILEWQAKGLPLKRK